MRILRQDVFDDNTINILCVPADSMAATTALVVWLAEVPEFVAMMKVKTEHFELTN